MNNSTAVSWESGALSGVFLFTHLRQINARSAFHLLMVFVSYVGCKSSEKPETDIPPVQDIVQITTDVVEEDVFQWPFCEPGTAKECVGAHPTTTALVCNQEGTAYDVEQTCLDEQGEAVWCLNGACAQCIPGSKQCKDDDIVLECNEEGVFEEGVTCSGELTGQICQQGACVKLCDLNKKYNSYMGCEYWAVDLDNAHVPGGDTGWFDAQGAQFSIVVGNPSEKYAAEVSIYLKVMSSEAEKYEEGVGEEVLVQTGSGGLPLDLSPIPPGELRIFRLEPRNVDATVLDSLAYRIDTSIPVTVYQFNPLDNLQEVFSNDASLLLPVDVLGKYYIAMTREQTFTNLRGYVTVVAVKDDTQVSLTVTAPTMASNGFDHLQPGDTIVVNMDRYDVFNIETYEPGADLTGTVVLSNHNVAVFGGSEASNAPNTATCGSDGFCEWDGETPCESLLDCIEFNTCCADHLEQQMLPVKTWGTSYLATKSMERGAEKDIWRIMAAENGTQVTTLPEQALIPVLNKGEWFEFESDEHFEIIAKKPILVGQYLAAEDAPEPGSGPFDADIGDPAFMLGVPVEQYRENYVVLAPEGYEYDYINITAPSDADVMLDGVQLAAEDFEPVSPGFKVARMLIPDGKHSVVSEKKIGVIVYGFDKYVSYGYPGGLDLNDLGLINETGE